MVDVVGRLCVGPRFLVTADALLGAAAGATGRTNDGYALPLAPARPAVQWMTVALAATSFLVRVGAVSVNFVNFRDPAA